MQLQSYDIHYWYQQIQHWKVATTIPVVYGADYRPPNNNVVCVSTTAHPWVVYYIMIMCWAPCLHAA